MKVSIISVTYNCADTVDTAARSLFKQTYSNVEYIVIDGASSDGTVEKLKSYGDKVDYFISERDNGLYDAINKGLGIASGDIIGFLHADDFFKSNEVIEKIVKHFSNELCDAVYGDLQYVHNNNREKVFRYWKAGYGTSGRINWGWMPPHPTLFLRKDTIKELGPYNLTYHISADYEYILRMLKNKNISVSYLSETLVSMRMGGISNRGILNIFRKSFEDYRIMRKYKLPFPFGALIYKNISKIPQIFT